MISYYELLGMIKDGKAPSKIKAHLTSKPREYRAIYDGGDLGYYELVNLKENDDEYYRYLMDSFIESMMFDKTIEILDEKNINDKARFQYSEIPSWFEKKELIKAINENFEKHQKAIYEIIDYLNSKGE